MLTVRGYRRPAERARGTGRRGKSEFDSTARRIGSYWENPKTRTFGELRIDYEEDRTLRAVLIGMLREAEH